MRVLNGQQVLMRIFVGERDKHRGKPVHEALVDLFRAERLAGATVIRGIVGFGAKSHLHTTRLLRLSNELPIIIEVVDTEENIDRVMPQINAVVQEGLITMEKVRVLRYAPTGKEPDSR